jgi:hypothetical protein
MTETLTPEVPQDKTAAQPPSRPPTRPASRTPPAGRPSPLAAPALPAAGPDELPFDLYGPPPPVVDPKRETPPPPGARPAPPPARPQHSRKQGLQVVIARANAGNETCLQGLRELLDAEPDLWREAGDLARYAEAQWVDVAAGQNAFLREAAKRHLAALKAELLGPCPTPLEELLVSQVGVTYLAAQYGEMAAAKPAQGRQGPEAVFRLKQAESAQKRHLAAMKTLAAVRAMSRSV